MKVTVCRPHVLTVICENVAADALINHMTFRQRLLTLPLSSACAVLCDKTSYGSLIQHISRCPLCEGDVA